MRIKNLFVLSGLLIIIFPACKGQRDLKKRYSLLTWEYNREGRANEFQLVKYNWTDSGYIRSELFKTAYYIPHYSHFKTTIYKNRYLVNARGDVFDLQTNKVIHDHIGDDIFIEQRNDTVLFRHTDYTPNSIFPADTVRHNSIKSDYYFFDIGTGKISPVYFPNEPFKYFTLSFPDKIPGSVLSPDKKLVAHFVPRKNILENDLPVDGNDFMICAWSRIFPTVGDIYINYSKTDSIKIADSVIFNFSIWFRNELPIIWLNNEEILTQKFNGGLIKINIRTKTTTSYPVLQDAMPCSYPASFEKTYAGDIIYHCRGKNGDLFKISKDSMTIMPVLATDISAIYTLSPQSGYAGNESAKGYFIKEKKLLDDSTATTHYAVTPENLIAIQCKEIIPSRNQYDYWNTVKIFDPEKNEWATIKIGYLQQMIGWIKEK